jgi:LPS export ABC transporter protein LptC
MRHFGFHRSMLALLLAGTLGASLLAGCGRQRSVGPASGGRELPDQEVSDFAVSETVEGRPEWKLYARYAATYSARNLVVARTVRIDFFDEQARRSSILTAREGEMHQRTRNMTARGNVVLQTTEGTRLSTEELRFLNRENLIVVPEDRLVRVQRGQDVLTGYGFESDPGLERYEFKRSVQATVHATPPRERPGSAPPRVPADSLDSGAGAVPADTGSDGEGS